MNAFRFVACVLSSAVGAIGANAFDVDDRQVNAMQAADVALLIYDVYNLRILNRTSSR